MERDHDDVAAGDAARRRAIDTGGVGAVHAVASCASGGGRRDAKLERPAIVGARCESMDAGDMTRRPVLIAARPVVRASLPERPDGLLARPDVLAPAGGPRNVLRVDPLSDVLRAVRLTGAYFYRVEAAAPWSVLAVAAREVVPRLLPEMDHVIPYHILTAGQCWAGVAGERRVRMEPGDVIVFPHGDSHLMSSDAGDHRDAPVFASAPDPFPGTVYFGPGAHCDTSLVCGFLAFDARPYNPLLASLPRCLHLRAMAGGWLAEFPRQVVAESRTNRLGSESMLTRMAELMFVECLRRHAEQVSAEQRGWLAGLTDPVVGAALVELHARPAHPWTLAELARAVASSRTVLAERFTRYVGVPPMQYLTQWRLQLAAEQLVRGTAKVAAIAAQVGYESEAAFSRAFKRATSQSPAEWRRVRREAS